jgi:hypothetical protein
LSHLAHAIEVLHRVQHGLGRGFQHLVNDLPVREEDEPFGLTRGAWIVGDHHDGLVEVPR